MRPPCWHVRRRRVGLIAIAIERVAQDRVYPRGRSVAGEAIGATALP